MNIEHLALLKFGLAVSEGQREEVIRMIKTTPSYKEDFERVKGNLDTMLDEDKFLEVSWIAVRLSVRPTPRSQTFPRTTR